MQFETPYVGLPGRTIDATRLLYGLSRLRSLDVFATVNSALFVLLCVFTYWDRFVAYRGAANAHEFLIYAVSILGATAGLWWHFRLYPFSWRVLLVVEVGILMHFAGAYVRTDIGRLYDSYVLGIRYDKYVHFFNAFGGVFLVKALFSHRHIVSTGINAVFVVSVVLGFGAVVEIIEYLVTLTIAHHGVGDYDNNMQDLMGNLSGAFAAVLLARMMSPRRSTACARS